MAFDVATAIHGGRAVPAAQRIAADLIRDLGDQPARLVLAFASPDQPLQEVAPTFQREFPDATLLACTTAGEFTEAGHQQNTISAIAVAGDLVVHSGLGIALSAGSRAAVDTALETIPEEVEGYPHRTAVALLDPLAGNGEETTLQLAARLGPETALVGGAAGDYLRMLSSEIALGEQVTGDGLAVAMLYSKVPFGVGVCHGHYPLSPPLEVTRAEGNTVFELEGRPAWEVWKEEVRDHSLAEGVDPDSLTLAEVGPFLLRYEAGLTLGDSLKIRAPLALEADGGIRFACGIPQGVRLQITQSEPGHQITSTRRAARRAREKLGSRPVAGAIVFDCVCRRLILGENFGTAIRSIHEELGGAPLAGFETYGEMALERDEPPGFHNSTTVVLAIPG